MSLHARDVRQDVRELGELLDEILADHATPEAFESVEAARTAAIDYRHGETNNHHRIDATISSGDDCINEAVARAFSNRRALTASRAVLRGRIESLQ